MERWNEILEWWNSGVDERELMTLYPIMASTYALSQRFTGRRSLVSRPLERGERAWYTLCAHAPYRHGNASEEL